MTLLPSTSLTPAEAQASSPLPLATGRAAQLLAAMAGRRVLVFGDVALDEYLFGQADRLSREAPVPVLRYDRRRTVPGAAANAARNLAALGAAVTQVALVGRDEAAGELEGLLRAAGIRSALVTDADRPTTVKTRIVAEGLGAPQQVARLDRLSREPASAAVEAALAEALTTESEGAQALLLSDYRGGAITPALAAACRDLAEKRGQLLTVDAQGSLERFSGYGLVRIGGQDAARSLGRELESEAQVQAVLRELLDRLAAGALVLGRGGQGTSAIDAAGRYGHLPPANVSEVFDVTGAGDTVIAVLTLALAAGATLWEAVALANAAAGAVVRRLGVHAPSAAEILAELGAVNR